MKIKLISLALMSGVISGCGGGSSADENAAACFNETLFKVGSRYSIVTKEGNNDAERSSFSVMETTQFRGQQAIKVNDEISGFNTYYSLDSSDKSYSILGVMDGDTEWYYTPGQQNKFDLNAGESFEQTYTKITVLPEQTADVVFDSVNKFIGIETITVPAGTYKTCRFEAKNTVTLPSGLKQQVNLTAWYAVRYGIQVKYEVDGVADELIEATIDGMKI
ncbi:hypothetical protein [uncultured Photobacterium sp.]|uniref:hypothetical protein n=1 Tax=uncultured Photobacterium sp. TaxID=173973 RepID=UPI00261B1691|nr:hypothetical protein [uncultured Photobacterium sp.]